MPASPRAEAPMKMYDFTLAPSPRRVRIFLAEKGIDVELVQVDIMRNANRTPEFYKKNPLGSLPILESRRRQLSFRERRDLPVLRGNPAGAAAVRRRRAREGARRDVESENRARNIRAGRPCLVAPEQGRRRARPADTGIWRDSETRGDRSNRVAESELEKREFIAGDRYSIADITTLCMIDFARTVDIRIQPEQTNLARWYSSVSSRPSAKA